MEQPEIKSPFRDPAACIPLLPAEIGIPIAENQARAT